MSSAGKKASLKIGTDTVKELNDISLSLNGETIDVTSFDSQGWKEFIQGLKGASISASGFYDPTDTTGQVALRTALLDETEIADVKYMVDASNGFGATCLVAGMEIGAAVAGEVTVSFELTVTGAVTPTP